MADNLTIQGSCDVLAAKDQGGVKYQEVLIGFSDSMAVDAFNRLRVSEPFTVFESKLLGSDKAPLLWDEELETGSGITGTTPTEAKPYIDFVSTDGEAGVYTRQTLRRFNYQSGKSHLVSTSGVLELASGVKTGCERQVGYFDDNNGAFFTSNEGTIEVVVRSNDSGTPNDTIKAQVDWSEDIFDGSNSVRNPSGILVDWTKSQIFVFDLQWLSAGRVRFGLEIGGRIYKAHEVNQANVAAIPWCSTPNLPIRYRMITTAESGICSMRVICSTVVSEGGQDPAGVNHSESTGEHTNANTTGLIYALLGMRLKSTHLGCTVAVLSVSLIAENKNDFEWLFIVNPTVAGTFTYGDKTSSCVQVATGDTVGNPSVNTITGGIILARGYGAGNTAITLDISNVVTLGAKIDGTRDTCVLAVIPHASNSDILGAWNWREVS